MRSPAGKAVEPKRGPVKKAVNWLICFSTDWIEGASWAQYDDDAGFLRRWGGEWAWRCWWRAHNNWLYDWSITEVGYDPELIARPEDRDV
jgi:hypothetical protein